MADDVALNKAGIIERCLARVREVHAGDDANLFDDPTRQDSIVLNLQRACEASIDLAMHCAVLPVRTVSTSIACVARSMPCRFGVSVMAGRIP